MEVARTTGSDDVDPLTGQPVMSGLRVSLQGLGRRPAIEGSTIGAMQGGDA